MRHVLEFERVTPEPGPDADAVGHEWVAHAEVDDPAGATLEIGGIATVWDVLVNGAVVASGRSMFERRSVDVSGALRAGDNEVRVVVHPLTDLLDELPRKPRARWRTMVVEEPRLRWVRTQVLGRAPGFAPGPPVVGPYRPMVLATEAAPGPQPARGDLVAAHPRHPEPRGHAHGREPVGGLAGPLGQRRAGLRPRRGVDAGRPRRPRHGRGAGLQPGPGQRHLGVRERRLLRGAATSSA